MADISAPYYPEDKAARILPDVFTMERQLFDENDDPVDMSDWVIGIEITCLLSPAFTPLIIANNSPFLTRPSNHKIRLKGPTAEAVGLTVTMGEAGKPISYEMRWYRVTEDGQETFWYIDLDLYKRLPQSINVAGPLMAEVFVHKLTSEGGISITTDIAASLETRIADLENSMATAGLGTVISLSAAQALASGPTPKEWVDTVHKKKYLYPASGPVLEIETVVAVA